MFGEGEVSKKEEDEEDGNTNYTLLPFFTFLFLFSCITLVNSKLLHLVKTGYYAIRMFGEGEASKKEEEEEDGNSKYFSCF